MLCATPGLLSHCVMASPELRLLHHVNKYKYSTFDVHWVVPLIQFRAASFVAILKGLYQHFKAVYPLRNGWSAHLSHPELSER